MSSISSVSSSIISSLYNSSSKSTKSAGSTTLDNLFAQLDTSNKGYIEKSDLASAFSQVLSTNSTTSGTTTDSATVDDVFSKLDGNGDGKVTKDELSAGVKNLADELDSQFNQMRMNGGMPPPPSDSDTGFTKDELTSQLSEIGSSDSTRSELLNKVVNNFAAADSDSDGKVSFQEAMAYDESTKATSSASSTAAASTTSATDTGFTKDQLTAQLSEIGSSDSTRSDLLNKIVNNFAAADADSDGKVSFQEARAYDESTKTSSTLASATDSTTSSDLAVMKRIMELMDAYALGSSTDSSSTLLNALSVSA